MNILVLSDNFLHGGSETYIQTIHDELSKSHKFFYGFSTMTWGGVLNENIETGFHFNSSVSIGEFCEDVDRLVKIIKDNKIEKIVVHQPYSLLTATFVANLTDTPLFYIYHGPSSMTSPYQKTSMLLFHYAMSYVIREVFSVRKNDLDLIRRYGCKKVSYFPNLIDLNKYKKQKTCNKKRWAIVSRLDEDKIEELKAFLRLLPELDIDEIDIYGDGACANELKSLNEKIRLKGFSQNINNSIGSEYTGVIATGRAIMEAMAMDLPVLLASNGKTIGIVDDELFDKIKDDNFVATNLRNVDKKKLQQDIRRINSGDTEWCRLRKEIEKGFSSTRAVELMETISNDEFSGKRIFLNLFENIRLCKNKEEGFFTSYDVAEKICDALHICAVDPFVQQYMIEIRGDIERERKNSEIWGEIERLRNDINNYSIRESLKRRINKKINKKI